MIRAIHKAHYALSIVATLFIFVLFIWYGIFAESRGGMLTVAFLDVGQGDAVFIESPGGAQMLIDAGAGRVVLRKLGEVMPFFDRSIDVVVATHPDEDHIGGMPDVLNRFRVSALLTSGVSFENALFDELKTIASGRGVDEIAVSRGMRIHLGADVYVDILFPDRVLARDIETNTSSVVARVAYGNTSFLLTGDLPAGVEEYLVSLDGEALRSNVVKLGHHGSRTSSSRIFLSAVSPEYAIVSAGKDNRYGHPHKEVMETLKEMNIPMLATYERGTIVLESDGKRVYVR